jgi:hypothetical protein
MDDHLLLDALADLRAAVERQTELQQQTNELLQVLITVLRDAGQATADLAEIIGQLGPIDEVTGPH